MQPPNGRPRVEAVHHVEIYVTNTYQAAHFYRTVLGFHTIGSLDAAASDSSSLLLQRGSVRLLLTAPLTPTSEVAEHILVHGEGIKDVALSVQHVDELFEKAIACGAKPLQGPTQENARHGDARVARIAACGDLVHSLIESADDRFFTSAVRPAGAAVDAPDTAIDGLDHVALALPAGELDTWVEFYLSGMGFRVTHQEDIGTEYSAMRSKVVSSPNGTVRFPMMEPAPGKRTSQIQHYVESHHGPGVQHLAFASHDIVKSVETMSANVPFLPTPAAYYDTLEQRVGELPGELDALRRHHIIADRDSSGLLLQVFTKPIGTRPTLFLEVVERRGAQGFGSGNIKALFQAVERTQALTGAV
jgi:4-hydroxyphenylpyruvate dioxygenase